MREWRLSTVGLKAEYGAFENGGSHPTSSVLMIPLAVSRMSRGYTKEDIRAEGIWVRTRLKKKKEKGKRIPHTGWRNRLFPYLELHLSRDAHRHSRASPVKVR